MAPRPDVSEDRRNQILDTAESVFAKHGFDEARMDDIAERSGLSKGAVYWYFKKKDDIIGALVDRVFRRSIDGMRRVAEEQTTAGQRLLRIGEQISRDYQAISRLMPIVLEFYAVALRQRSIRKHLAGIYEQMLSILVPLLEEGIRNGEFTKLDARRTAIMFVGSYEGLGLLWALSPKLVDWKLDGPEAAMIFLKGLEKR